VRRRIQKRSLSRLNKPQNTGAAADVPLSRAALPIARAMEGEGYQRRRPPRPPPKPPRRSPTTRSSKIAPIVALMIALTIPVPR
jgi:hypothetical protein